MSASILRQQVNSLGRATSSCGGYIKVEHLSEHGENGAQGPRRQGSEPLSQSLAVDRSKLIQGNSAILAGEPARWAKGIVMPGRGHWCDDHCPEVMIELVGRDDEAWAGFADLAAACRTELDQVDLTAAGDQRLST